MKAYFHRGNYPQEAKKSYVRKGASRNLLLYVILEKANGLETYNAPNRVKEYVEVLTR
jgi:hypothetical protein